MTVLVSRDGPIATLTLNRASVGNVIDEAMAADLVEAAAGVAGDPAIRSVVLTGAGKLFCGGGDIRAMQAATADASEFLFGLANTLNRAVVLFAEMAKPLVVLVNGPAAGAGLSLAMAGDVVLAGRSAHFIAAYRGVGLTPDGGMSWFLPRLVGLRRAQEMIMTNRRVSADEAAAIGLVTRIVDDASLAAEGLAVAQALAAGPVAAISGACALLASSFESGLRAQLDAEARRVAEAGGGAEFREGVAAFLERRRPDFVAVDGP